MIPRTVPCHRYSSPRCHQGPALVLGPVLVEAQADPGASHSRKSGGVSRGSK